MEDIRWKQRFDNYCKALTQLTEFIEKGELNKFEKQGFIQSFEYTYELAWRVMKDYAEYQANVEIGRSRDAIRYAFNNGLISDGASWLEMVKDRILSVHTYDETTADNIVNKIYQIHYGLFLQFKQKMLEKWKNSDFLNAQLI